MPDQFETIFGALLGTVVGDAIGLPYEALSHRRGVRMLGPVDRHRFFFGRGMMSDDGEHACITLQAFCVAGGTDVDRFARSLAWRLRWWILGIPAGIGAATLRACGKLWLGVPPTRSGVFSAGNGPAMRAAVLGAAIADPANLRAFVLASTTLTHSDPKAFYGAMAVAIAAHEASRNATPDAYVSALRCALPEADAAELLDRIGAVLVSVKAGEPTGEFARALGADRGVSGYIYQTVPVALHAWMSHPNDFSAAVRVAVECGGDTDTVAAIAGGIVAAGGGAACIPAGWIDNMLEWPRNTTWLTRLARCATEATQTRRPVIPPPAGPLVLVRNLMFAGTVLAHVARRVLPPY